MKKKFLILSQENDTPKNWKTAGLEKRQSNSERQKVTCDRKSTIFGVYDFSSL